MNCGRQCICFQRYFRRYYSGEFGNARRSKHVQIDHMKGISPSKIIMDQDISFPQILFGLMDQAKRSVLIKTLVDPNVDEEHLKNELWEFFSKRNEVASVSFISTSENHVKNFVVEFTSQKAWQSLSSAHEGNGFQVRAIKLKPTNVLLQKSRKNNAASFQEQRQTLYNHLQDASDMSEQISRLQRSLSITSEEFRGKLWFGSVIGDFFSSHMGLDFSSVPFGSAMFGLGSKTSDMDFTISKIRYFCQDSNTVSVSTPNQLTYSDKHNFIHHRRQDSITLFTEAIKQIGSANIDGMQDIQLISGATIPLLTMQYAPLDTTFDVVYENFEAIKVAWCFNTYARMDERVVDFSTMLRVWAKSHNLSLHGGPLYDGFTPFMITCLGIFYLMRRNLPVIPPMFKLITKFPKPHDLLLGSINTMLVLELPVMEKKDTTSSVEELFIGAMEYYSTFNFETHSVDLLRGSPFASQLPNIGIRLPFGTRNVSKGCSLKSARRLNKAATNTLRKLEVVRHKGKHKDWGVLGIMTLPKDLF